MKRIPVLGSRRARRHDAHPERRHRGRPGGPGRPHRAVSAGATWFTAQLTDGLLHNDQYDFDDLGLSADVAFALEAVGGHDATVAAIAGAVAPRVEESVRRCLRPPSLHRLRRQSQSRSRRSPTRTRRTSMASDLQEVRLEELVATSAPIVGRVQNDNELSFPDNQPTRLAQRHQPVLAARGLDGQDSARPTR